MTRLLEDNACEGAAGVLLAETSAGRFFEAVGHRNDPENTPVRRQDRFEIGSNTKSFTVVLALQMQEEGLLSMDDSLTRWLPEWGESRPGWGKITLRHLASNTSGIPDYADPLMQPLVENNDQAGLARAWTAAQLVDFAFHDAALEFEPGAEWNYSSTNFILLGLAVERASGKPLPALMQERIFEPLGMNDTLYPTGVPEDIGLVDGFYRLPDGRMADMTGWNTSQGGAAGAIVSTAEDMMHYARGLFEGRLFRQASTLDEMLTVRSFESGEGGLVMSGYALGLMQFRLDLAPMYGHGGQTPGFQTLWSVIPDRDTYLVLLTNAGACPVSLFPFLLDPATLGLSAPDSEDA